MPTTPMDRPCLRASIGVALAASLIAAFVLPAATTAATKSLISPYFGASFKTKETPFALGQASFWDTNGRVLANLYDSEGIRQIYRVGLDGSNPRCLTCSTVEGPNGFAQPRPQNDWILFHSYGQQPVHTGGPGLGGYGGDLYVMRRDGSDPYRLTTDSDPNDGEQYTLTSGVPYDNFHAYFSPNGKQIVWTHTEAHPVSQGGQAWSILVGDFRVEKGVPSLENVRVVGKPYGAYETQDWAPDGSGFLFSAAGGHRSPFQASPPGWGNMNLYYMRIKGPGASIEHPRVTRLLDDMPAYEEQSILTPDMRTVIAMSNRSHTTPDSWANLIVAAAQRTKYDPPETGSSQTLQFLADFIPPTHFNSDLYAIDVKTKAIRQLTSYPRGVIPELGWNEDYTKILYSVNGAQWATGSGKPPTYTGEFPTIAARHRRIPENTPRALYGRPVRMSRVGAQAQEIRDRGPTDNVAVPVEPPSDPAPAMPLGTESKDKPQVPVVTFTYAPGWLSDLTAILTEASESFSNPPLLSALGQFQDP